jgi:hypothetical protein
MNASAAARFVVVAGERPVPRPPPEKQRHYRLARVRVARLRTPREPFSHLARMHD